MAHIIRRWWRSIREIWYPPRPICSPGDALLYASDRGDIQLVKELLARGTPPDEVRTTRNQTAMWLAAHHGHTAVAEALLKADADPNLDDGTGISALTQAAIMGNVRIIKLIAKYKQHAFITQPAARALREAILNKDRICVRALLDGGTSVSARMAGFPPAVFDAASFDASCLAELLEEGADLHETDNTGRTPLHYASMTGEDTCVRILVAWGANVYARDHAGRMPVDLARTEMVQRLLLPLPPVRPLMNGGLRPAA